MGRSKNWMSYPDTFVDLVNTACVQSIVIPCADEKAAKSLQGYIYGFFSALQKEANKPNGDEKARELRRMSCKIKLHRDGAVLTAMPRDMDSVAQSVADALRTQTANPISSDELKPSADLVALADDSQRKPDPE